MAEALSSLEVARAALHERQGPGARYDAPDAPARELDWARRGTAYFARKLNELSDVELNGESRSPGWTRRHVIACVAYHARMLTRVTETARTGAALPLYETPTQRDEEIEDGATLPAGALRHLVAHANIHLNVEWRDLQTAEWDSALPFEYPTTARATPWMRAKQVWLRALDLENGADPRDFPRDFLAALLADLPGGLVQGEDLPALVRSRLRPQRQDY